MIGELTYSAFLWVDFFFFLRKTITLNSCERKIGVNCLMNHFHFMCVCVYPQIIFQHDVFHTATLNVKNWQPKKNSNK